MDVAAWLRGLGLEQYAQAFSEHAISDDVLPSLTADDLEAMGILVVGHRRRMLDAIAALRSRAGLPTDGGAAPHAASKPAPNADPSPQAERRQLTILFVDLVGSTALSQRLDPEEMREVLRAYRNAVVREIARFEGHVAKFMGDGVLAYFGWPGAHEDEAERAVRAGLAIVETVGRLETPARAILAVRVGIATGLVVVGDLIGKGGAEEETVVGETPHVAARLQARAQPGQVIVAESTRRLIGGLFEVEELDPHPLRGFVQLLRAFRILGRSRAEGRFESLHAETIVPLVGREQELALLLDRWRQAEAGQGQVVLLTGEPGMGKSRLILALRERLSGPAHTSLRFHGSPYHMTRALWPVIDHFERAGRFLPQDSPETRLSKLQALLDPGRHDRDETLSLLAALLNISTGAHDLEPDLPPQRRKVRTFGVLLDLLATAIRRKPALMVLEDAHWLDATTTELLDLTIDRLRHLPALLVVVFRPEFKPPWTDRAHVTRLRLSRLRHEHGAAIIGSIAGGKPLPPEIIEPVLTKADGVPLFVEELTKAALEAGLLKDTGDRYVLAGPVPELPVPASLHDSLLARLGRLGAAREVAQIAAAIGREFPYKLLAAIAPLSEPELREALDRLVDAELVFRRGAPPDATYSFKHALVRDAAYGSLLKSRRRQIHARIAAVLERQFPDQAAARPELLTYHDAEAGLVEKTVGRCSTGGGGALGP